MQPGAGNCDSIQTLNDAQSVRGRLTTRRGGTIGGRSATNIASKIFLKSCASPSWGAPSFLLNMEVASLPLLKCGAGSGIGPTVLIDGKFDGLKRSIKFDAAIWVIQRFTSVQKNDDVVLGDAFSVAQSIGRAKSMVRSIRIGHALLSWPGTK